MNVQLDANGMDGSRLVVHDGRDAAITDAGRPYPARLLDDDLRLYEIADDRGALLRLSMYARTLTNGGYWHLREDEGQIAANT